MPTAPPGRERRRRQVRGASGGCWSRRLEVQDQGAGVDRLLAALGEAAGCFALDLDQAVERVRQYLGRVLPALFVDGHRRPAQVPVVELVERLLVERFLDVVEGWFERRARQAAAEALRQPRPLVVGEELAAGGTVEVLGGAAALLRVDELDAVVFLEHAHVVGDEVEALVELVREHVRARDLFIQNDQDLHPQGVGEGFSYYLFYALFFVLGLRHGLFSRFVSRTNGR